MNLRHQRFVRTGLLVLLISGGAGLAQEAPTQAQLLERLEAALQKPDPSTHPDQIRGQLDKLVQDAAQLARLSDPGRARLQALTLQMQGLALRIRTWPDDPQAEDLLWILRQAAQQAAQQPVDEAAPAAGFWSMVADLIELSRSSTPAEARKTLASEKIRAYLDQWPQAPASEALRAALKKLEPASDRPADPPVPAFQLNDPRTEAPNLKRYELTSAFQPAPQGLRILLPESFALSPKVPDVIFLLPAEAGEGRELGDPLRLIQESGLHNRLNVIFVQPRVAQAPWMVDAVGIPAARQESHLVQAVVPAVDKILGGKPARRMLLGFSKGGWAALSLLARHPGLFDAAASWDAPLMVLKPDRLDLDKFFSSEADFASYVLPQQFRRQATALGGRKRVALMGYDFYRDHLQQFHQFLSELGIPHDYADGPRHDHAWNLAWLQAASERLIQMPR